MGYVIYNIESTRKLGDRVHSTERTAKSALTRAVNAGKVVREEYAIADTMDFNDNIEKFVTRSHALTGEEFQERINTPISCSPAYETYWSM